MLVQHNKLAKATITVIAVTVKYKTTANTSNKTITRDFGKQTLYIGSTKELIVSMYSANGKCLWSSDWSNANVAPNTCRTYNVGNDVVKIKVRTKSGTSTVNYWYN